MNFLYLVLASITGMFTPSFFCYADTPEMTYWVDISCTSRPYWDATIQETFLMAERSVARLNKDSDTDFAAVFERIFGVKKSDPTTFTPTKKWTMLTHPRKLG